MIAFIIELLVEAFFEVVAAAVSVAVGAAIGTLVMFLVRLARWTLRGLQQPTEVLDPQGGLWLVRIPLAPAPFRLWGSTRLFSMGHEARSRRLRRGLSSDAVETDSLAHPKGLADRTDEAAGCVAPLLLLGVLLALAIFLLEAIVAAVVATVVVAVRLAWGRWRCEVVAPDGSVERIRAGSMREALAERSAARERISGLPR